MKTESGPSETRERGFVSNPGQGAVSAVRAAATGIAATNVAFASDDEAANNRAEACQPAISDNQSSSFLSASPSSQSALQNQATGSRIPYWLIGILLTATAIAKLWMLLTDPFADVRVGLPREILWLSVAFELWLAFENFRLRDHRVMAFVNTIVFAAFAIFASIRLAMGYSSCGCSGSLELPAWFFVLVDIGIVICFLSSISRRSEVFAGLLQVMRRWNCWSVETRGRIAGLGLFAGLVLGLQLPAVAPLRAAILGEPLITSSVKYEGELKLSQEVVGTVEFVNRSHQAAKIIGFSKSCRCFDISEDPTSKTIAANGRVVLPLVIKPNKVGPLHQRIELFLEHPDQVRVNVDFIGYVKGE